MIEWESPSVVVRTVPYGETGLLVTLFTQDHGIWRGMVRGGASRRQSASWQPGTLCVARWKARSPEQLGSFTAEVVNYPAALLLDCPLPLAMLSSACALSAEALPEKEAYPGLFKSLVRLLGILMVAPDPPPVAAYLRWEALLLQELGYGLDLGSCAVTGQTTGLCYVSPRSGRAVSEEGAGRWKDRLLPLPSFFLDETQDGTVADWVIGQHLTGHFLQNVLFAACHRPCPSARVYFEQHLHAWAGKMKDGKTACLSETKT